MPQLKVEIVRRCNQANGFVVLPKRWIVERTIAWLNRCRRLTKDWEISTATLWLSVLWRPFALGCASFATPLKLLDEYQRDMNESGFLTDRERLSP